MSLVREDDERNGRRDAALAVRAVDLRARRCASRTLDDLLAVLQEQFAIVEALIEDAARIAAQVEDDALRALALKLR